MSNPIIRISKKMAALSYIIGVGSLIVGILLSIIHLPASAAATYDESQATATSSGSASTCTAPDGWDKTIRLFYSQTASTQWTFDVEEPEMDIVLQFFYFQDYDRQGCPFDCTTGACQPDEIGKGQSPFGRFTITDGKLGNNDGVIKQQGRLKQGTYQADFHVTGHGSINIGLRVSKKAVTATSTAEPTETEVPPTDMPTESIAPVATETNLPPTENSTATPLIPSPTGVFPTDAATETSEPTAAQTSQTPTETPVTQPATDVPPSATATIVAISPVTSSPPTPTNSEVAQPHATKTPRVITPTATPYTAVQPASPTRTALPTRTVGPVNTLAPPSGNSGSSTVLIPRTGADLTGMDPGTDLARRLFLLAGIGLVGLGFVVQSFGKQLSRQ